MKGRLRLESTGIPGTRVYDIPVNKIVCIYYQKDDRTHKLEIALVNSDVYTVLDPMFYNMAVGAEVPTDYDMMIHGLYSAGSGYFVVNGKL